MLVYLRIGFLFCSTFVPLNIQLILSTSLETFLNWRNLELRCSFTAEAKLDHDECCVRVEKGFHSSFLFLHLEMSKPRAKKVVKPKFEMPIDKRFDFSGIRDADPGDLAR